MYTSIRLLAHQVLFDIEVNSAKQEFSKVRIKCSCGWKPGLLAGNFQPFWNYVNQFGVSPIHVTLDKQPNEAIVYHYSKDHGVRMTLSDSVYNATIIKCQQIAGSKYAH